MIKKWNIEFLLFFSMLAPVLLWGQNSNWNGDFDQGWKEFDRLIKAWRSEDASSLAIKMLADARAEGNSTEWTRCLIRYAQIKLKHGRFQEIAHFLEEQSWPDDSVSKALLNLYYAQALAKIDQRIIDEQKAWKNVWKCRDELGKISNIKLGDYIQPNNYPPGIRPTMRDSVSYLWVEMLADEMDKNDDQRRAVLWLDLKKLAGPNVGEVSLADPATHPIEKICYILTDLENWHAQRQELEAALESRLERYRILHRSFAEEKSRHFIESELESYLKALRELPWWAEGVAQLAEFVRFGTDSIFSSDSLARARQIAIQGDAGHPESIGGKHCRAIMKQIEAPDFLLSGMQNDLPYKKSVLATYKNLDRLYFRAYPVDFIRMIETCNCHPFRPSESALQTLMSKTSPAFRWQDEFEATPDYQLHRKFIVPPISRPGAYLIVASAHPDFAKEDNKMQGLLMTVGDLDILWRTVSTDKDIVEVTIVSGTNGHPIADAEVLLYGRDSGKPAYKKGEKRSDTHGIVRFEIDATRDRYFIVARNGDQVAYHPSYLYFNPLDSIDSDLRSDRRTLITTDRAVYNPSQKVSWKAVFCKQSKNRRNFTTAPGGNIVISLKDAQNRVIESKKLTANEFGTGAGEFLLPAIGPLGTWRLTSSDGGQTTIQIEDYKRAEENRTKEESPRPTFEIKISDMKQSFEPGEAIQVRGAAKYSSGLPASSSKVKWLALRRARFLPTSKYWWNDAKQIVAGGTASLNEDGSFSISFLHEIDERLRGNEEDFYEYSVVVEATDGEGKSYFASKSFVINPNFIYAGFDLDNRIPWEEDPITISINRRSLAGGSKAEKGNWRIASLKAPSETLVSPARRPIFFPNEYKAKNTYQIPDDQEQERWRRYDPYYDPAAILMQWEEGSVKASGSVSHDDKGSGSISIGPLPAGAYRLIYETLDDFGKKYEYRQNFIVAGPSMRLPLPVILSIDKKSVNSNGNIRILAYSGFKNQPMIIDIYSNGKRKLRRELIAGKGSPVFSIPITKEDRGKSLGIVISIVRDNRFIWMQTVVGVPRDADWNHKALNVEFSNAHDRLKSGEDESWSVNVTKPSGKNRPVPNAELLVYMSNANYDPPADRLRSFLRSSYVWNPRDLVLSSNDSDSLVFQLDKNGFHSEASTPVLAKDKLADLPDPDPSALVSEFKIIVAPIPGSPENLDCTKWAQLNHDVQNWAEWRVRNDLNVALAYWFSLHDKNELYSAPGEQKRNFFETVFWFPNLITDSEGTATFSFKVPNYAAEWLVRAFAITRDLEYGQKELRVKFVKD
jgi:alpha-2-macroglobulin